MKDGRPDVKTLSIEDLRTILLTVDGQGKVYKANALEELIERTKDELYHVIKEMN